MGRRDQSSKWPPRAKEWGTLAVGTESTVRRHLYRSFSCGLVPSAKRCSIQEVRTLMSGLFQWYKAPPIRPCAVPQVTTFAPDNNGPPSSYKTPYASAHFQATQRQWWQCTCYQSGNLQLFVPDIVIDRYIEQTGAIWKYRITKSGSINSVALP